MRSWWPVSLQFTWSLAVYHKDFGLYSERDSYWKVLGKRNYLLYFLKKFSRHCVETNLEMEYGQWRAGSRVDAGSSVMRLPQQCRLHMVMAWAQTIILKMQRSAQILHILGRSNE